MSDERNPDVSGQRRRDASENASRTSGMGQARQRFRNRVFFSRLSSELSDG
jgi:hypothetical protein